MIPALHHLTPTRRWSYFDSSGTKVAALEERSNSMMSLVGVNCNSKVIISAPTNMHRGFARVRLCNREGICRDSEGIEKTRMFLVAMHNRSVGHVIVHSGYIIGSFYT